MNVLANELEQRPRVVSMMASVVLVALIGTVDYVSGYTIFFSAFYLLPVALAAWFVGSIFGMVISLLSMVVWLAGDIIAGAQYSSAFVPAWNGVIGLTVYFVVVKVLASLRKLHNELEDRVRQRTEALINEMQERARLEKAILEIGEREQRRIGHDLHDSLCQHLATAAMAGQMLREKLATKSSPETVEAEKIVLLVKESITLTRNLARGISPIEMEMDGLITALHELAANISQFSKVNCTFSCESLPMIDDTTMAMHLYRIAQEAVNNAIRHGKPGQIRISLSRQKEDIALAIEDNGAGLAKDWQKNRGLGTRIMAHRAAMIGGTFSIEPNPTGGTRVRCSIPISAATKTRE